MDWIPWAKATVTLSRDDAGQPPLAAEQLLAKLLLAREELADVLGRYGDLVTGADIDSPHLWETQVSSVGGAEAETTQARDNIVSRQRQQRLFLLAQAHRPVSPSPSDGSFASADTTVLWSPEDVRQHTATMTDRPSSIATFDSGSDTEYDPMNSSHVAAKSGMEGLDDDVRSLNTIQSRML